MTIFVFDMYESRQGRKERARMVRNLGRVRENKFSFLTRQRSDVFKVVMTADLKFYFSGVRYNRSQK